MVVQVSNTLLQAQSADTFFYNFTYTQVLNRTSVGPEKPTLNLAGRHLIKQRFVWN